MSEDMLTYLHLVDIDKPNEPYEIYRLLDRELTVGMIIEKSQSEGYVPHEVISYTHKDKVFGDRDLYEVQIKKHPFIKTHCRHEWVNPKPITVAQHLIRHCSKCNIQEKFNYGLGKWENND